MQEEAREADAAASFRTKARRLTSFGHGARCQALFRLERVATAVAVPLSKPRLRQLEEIPAKLTPFRSEKVQSFSQFQIPDVTSVGSGYPS